FLRRAADLADHNDRIRIRIVIEQLQNIDEFRALDRVAADADRGRLTDAAGRQLMNRFVRQRTGARYDADVALRMDIARHDADLAFVRRNDARAVRPDQAGLLAF